MHEFSPGLAGVPAAKSSISFVDGQTGLLEYRGISIEELAKQSSFLETTHLLLYDELPTQTELDRFMTDVTEHRRIKYQISDLIKCLPDHGHPMDALQAVVAALGMFYQAGNVLDRQVQYWSTIRLIAKVPTIVAAYYRLRRGDEQIQPRDDLDYAGNFLYMLTEKVPDPLVAKVLDTCLILHAEHTMNASTFSGHGDCLYTGRSLYGRLLGNWDPERTSPRRSCSGDCRDVKGDWVCGERAAIHQEETRCEGEAYGIRSSHL